jgi:glucose/arabinose dehydrogenase
MRSGTSTNRRRTPAHVAAGVGRLGVALLAGHLLLGSSCDRTMQTVFVAHFDQPMYLTAPPGDARLFVVERAGVIRVVNSAGVVHATPFLDIHTLVGTAGEGGLLGLAFSPDYAVSGEFYVYYTDTANDAVLARYQVSATNRSVANPASREVVLTVQDVDGQTHHRGGTIAFSPSDGKLYWALVEGMS